MLTYIDLWDRRCPRLEGDLSILGENVVRVLEAIAPVRQMPKRLRGDDGPEFTGKALDRWLTSAGVQLAFIRPGRPMENRHLEKFQRQVF